MSQTLRKNSPTQRFSDRVENYVKYRPTYPPQILDFMRAQLGLNKDSVIVDVGSGTGISSELFLSNGNTVYGVEPNASMREAAELELKKYPRFRSQNGSAEATGLPSGIADFVIAAQAFHWFQLEQTKKEFRRLLKPKGRILLLWNDRITSGFRFAEAYENFIHHFALDYKQVTHKNVQDHHMRELLGEFQIQHFSNYQEFDFDGLLGRVLSTSYMPNTDHPGFADMKEALNTLFTRHARDGRVRIEYDTQLIY